MAHCYEYIIWMKYCLNFEIQTFGNNAQIVARDALPFHCQYLHCKANISTIDSFHCKYSKCKTNAYQILVFYLKYFR